MRITIYQPQYFPRLHYFNRLLDADIFVILDSAQYVKSLTHEGERRERHKSYQSDTPVKSPQGVQLLTVPVKHSGKRPIAETEVEYGQKWQARHVGCVRNYYTKAPYAEAYLAEVVMLIKGRYGSLAELNERTILWAISRLLNLDIPVSDLSIEAVNEALAASDAVRLQRIVLDKETAVQRPEGRQQGTAWTIRICEALKANEYMYGGVAAKAYMDFDAYKRAGIVPIEQDWRLQEYPQLFSDRTAFIPNLSIIDLLLNVGSRNSLRLLTSSA